MSPWKLFAITLLLIPFYSTSAVAQEKPASGEGEKKMDWFGMIQLWNTYTMDAEDASGDTIHNRGDLYLRRGRFGVKGSVRSDLVYKICIAYDNLGKNPVTAGSGGNSQLDDNKELYIWDSIFTWKVDPTWFNMSIGYFRPQVGRESITTSFKINSFIKSLANTYVRKHIVGRGPGRETGINAGGFYHNESWGFNYNLGVFDTNHDDIQGTTTSGGAKWSPLLTGRVAFTLGDPEMKSYGMGYTTNYYGKRNGATLAANYTLQDETDVFKRNNMLGVDLLANYANLNVSGEIDWLKRDMGQYSYTDVVYHGRVGYNIPLENGQFLEPTVMHTRFNADTNSVNAASTQDGTGVGVNWYINKHKCKVNLHYTWQDDYNTKNKGNFLGLGLQLVF